MYVYDESRALTTGVQGMGIYDALKHRVSEHNVCDNQQAQQVAFAIVVTFVNNVVIACRLKNFDHHKLYTGCRQKIKKSLGRNIIMI